MTVKETSWTTETTWWEEDPHKSVVFVRYAMIVLAAVLLAWLWYRESR